MTHYYWLLSIISTSFHHCSIQWSYVPEYVYYLPSNKWEWVLKIEAYLYLPQHFSIISFQWFSGIFNVTISGHFWNLISVSSLNKYQSLIKLETSGYCLNNHSSFYMTVSMFLIVNVTNQYHSASDWHRIWKNIYMDIFNINNLKLSDNLISNIIKMGFLDFIIRLSIQSQWGFVYVRVHA